MRAESDVGVGLAGSVPSPYSRAAERIAVRRCALFRFEVNEFALRLAWMARELWSNLVFKEVESSGDLIALCDFDAVFELHARNHFGQVIESA